MSGLFEELKRRNVIKVGTAYVVLGWLLAQVTDVFLEPFGTPDWVIKTILIVILGGFPLTLFLAWAFEMTPEGIKKEKDVDRTESITQETGLKLNLAIILILVIALGYFAVDKFYLASLREAEKVVIAEENQTPVSEVATTEKSIAVLPFVNMSDDSSNEYFSDGISEEILNSLARVKELKVAGRTSSFAFKGKNQDLRQIGDALGVEHILEGSVRKAGTKVRITAQLIQVDDGFHLWSDTYDRELDDVFAIQDEIATAILEQLKAHLLDGQAIVVTSTRTDSQAYDLYLQGKQRIYERKEATLEAAAEVLDRAIAIDPEYAPAYAQRGIATLLLADSSYGTIPEEQSQSQARLYLDQALRLEPEQAEALAGMGLYFGNIPGETERRIDYLQRALAINPNLINASNWLQIAYSDAGKREESIAIAEKIVEYDPLYRPGLNNLFFIHLSRRDLDKAQALIDRVRPLLGNDPALLRLDAQMHYARGQFASGLRLLEQVSEATPNNLATTSGLNAGYMMTAQFERATKQGEPWQRFISLWALGRTEEATLLAQEQAASGEDVGMLILLLVDSGQAEEVVRFFDERWDSLDAYVADYPPMGRGDVGTLLDLAWAFGHTGNSDRFDEAMARSRESIDQQKALGYRFPFLYMNEAVYHVMAGDQQQSLEYIALAVDGNIALAVRLTRISPALRIFNGDPEFEALQQRVVDHMNSERAELGLEPHEI
jgi:TolB-like protein/Tfp pilus assembly protein PilF